MEKLKKRGIDCFDPWTSAQYRSRIALDLMKVATDAKIPLVLPEKRKAT